MQLRERPGLSEEGVPLAVRAGFIFITRFIS